MFDNDEFDRWMAQASDTLKSARQDCLYNANHILAEYSTVVSSKLGKFTGVLYGSVARGDYNRDQEWFG